MSNLKISLSEVNQIASELRRINANLDDILEYTRNEMKSLNNIWQSDGYEMIRQRYEYFAKKFALEKETIEAYARFLDHIVTSYDSLESTITENASNFT